MVSCNGFIFDVDATLVDTEMVIENIWRAWAKRVDIDFTLVQPHVHGRKIEETLRCVDEHFANHEQLLTVQSIAVEEMKKASAIPGAQQFVAKIANGAWGIATSGPRHVASTSLKAAGFSLPSVMICAEDVGKGKPDPEPFLAAVDALKVPAKKCVVFEDSPAGIKSAKAAGCYTIALMTSHKADELADADLIIDGFEALVLSIVDDTYTLTIRQMTQDIVV
ncbi:HAD-IA family hydrolase [Vibrio kasasachensis]|uniref:HAD-IA family hydrolase n=1 Tax=Vibrio kasasachensis TaxID=2910248 RepID=UPI003D1454BD